MINCRKIHVLGPTPLGIFVAHALKSPTQDITFHFHRLRPIQIFEETCGLNVISPSGITIFRDGFCFEAKDKRMERRVPYVLRLLEDLRRREYVPAIAKHQIRHRPIEAKQPPKLEEIHPDSIIDVLIITKITGQVGKGIEDVYHRLTRSSTIVLLHNGMGVLEKVQSYWREDLRPNIIEGYSSHGLTHVDEFKVNHWARGEIPLAIAPRLDEKDPFTTTSITHPSLPQNVNQLNFHTDIRLMMLDRVDKYRSLVFILRQLLGNSILNCNLRAYMPHFYVIQLRRTAVQCIIQVLSTVQDCTYVELIVNDHSRRLIDSLVHELLAVLEADPIASSPIFSKSISLPKLTYVIRRMIFASPSHISALRHQLNAKQQNELNSFAGYFIGLADLRGLKVPQLQLLSDIVHALGQLEDNRRNNFAAFTTEGALRDLPEWTYGMRERYWKVSEIDIKTVRTPHDMTADLTEDMNDEPSEVLVGKIKTRKNAFDALSLYNTSVRGNNYRNGVQTSPSATDNQFSVDTHSSIDQAPSLSKRLLALR
jgi:2-dehydropantoate 2-reductase